jgi:hypothetical protein
MRKQYAVVVREVVEKQVLIYAENLDEIREGAFQVIDSHGPYLVIDGSRDISEIRVAAKDAQMTIW